MKKKHSLFLILLLFLTEKSLAISFEVSSLYLVYNEEKPYGQPSGKLPENIRQVTVKNKDSHPLYLSIHLEKIHNIGEKNERVEKQLEQSPQTFGMVADNNKLVIGPNQQRVVNLFFLHDFKDLSSEIFYRAIFSPVVSTTFKSKSKESNKNAVGVNFIPNYEVKLFVQPNHKTRRVDVSRTHNTVLLENKGNVSDSLARMFACPHNVVTKQVEFAYRSREYEKIVTDMKCTMVHNSQFIYPGQKQRYDVTPYQEKTVIVIMNNRATYNATALPYMKKKLS